MTRYVEYAYAQIIRELSNKSCDFFFFSRLAAYLIPNSYSKRDECHSTLSYSNDRQVLKRELQFYILNIRQDKNFISWQGSLGEYSTHSMFRVFLPIQRDA